MKYQKIEEADIHLRLKPAKRKWLTKKRMKDLEILSAKMEIFAKKIRLEQAEAVESSKTVFLNS